MPTRITMRLFLCFISTFCILALHAQKHNNTWYFGDHAGIDFNTGTPVALTNGQLNTFEGCACISDSSGQILFYTDGVTVYNKLHQIMSNGTGLHGNSTSTHSAIIVPRPLSNRYFYIFTIDAFAGGYGMKYSYVDIQANAGNGEVLYKNVPVCAPATEKVVAVKHTNNIDVWIITHTWNSSQFNSYLLTSGTFSPVPVVSIVGSYHGTLGTNDAIGQMKVSPDKTKIALGVGDSRFYEIFEFNATTGILTNAIHITNPDSNPSSRAYGVEFSPNSQFLYTSNTYSTSVYQFNMINYNTTSIISSKQLVGSVTGNPIYYSAGLQLGPDNKIYVARHNNPWLGCISNPDNQGTACNVVNDAVNLNGRQCKLGLPTSISNVFFPVLIQADGCFLGPYSFSLSNTTSVTSVLWNFNDSGSSTDTSSLFNPEYTFSAPGNYFVQLIIAHPDGSTDTVTQNVIASNIPDLITQDTINLCAGDSADIQINNSFSSVIWSTGDTASMITISQAGVYSVTAMTADSCYVFDTLTLIIHPIPFFSIGPDTTGCEGDSIMLSGPQGVSSYTWSNGSQIPEITVFNSGIYWLLVSNSFGCQDADTVVVDFFIPPPSNLTGDTVLCEGQSVLLDPGSSFSSYLWSTGSVNQTITVTESGSYYLTLTSGPGCASQDSIQVTIIPAIPVNLGNDTSYCQPDSFMLTPGGGFQTYTWNDGSNGWFFPVFQTGLYSITVSDTNGCMASDSINVTVNPSYIQYSDITFCEGDSVLLVGHYYYVSSIVYDSLGSVMGCDSITTYFLTMVNTFHTQQQLSICNGDSVLIAGSYKSLEGTYNDTLLSVQACDSIIQTTLTLFDIPEVRLPNDTSFCQGSTLLIDAQNPGATFIWSTGHLSQSIEISDEGQYIVTVTNSYGCSVVDSIYATTVPNPQLSVFPATAMICRDSAVTVRVTGADSYFWSPSTGLSSTTDSVVIAKPPFSITYKITGHSVYGCTSDTFMFISVENPPTSILPDSLFLCEGEITWLDPGFCFQCTYYWNNLSNTQEISIDAPGTYWVKISNPACSIRDTILIKDCIEIWIPNAFSPNNDGINDEFIAKGINIVEFRMIIFNRWGNQLFESNNISFGWDGKYKETLCPPDVYVYYIQYTGYRSNLKKISKQATGMVVLIK